MTLSRAKNLFSFFSWAIIVLLSGCKSNERNEPKPRVSIDYFSMHVNGQEWKPFQSKEDPCSGTYRGTSYDLNGVPFYRIDAQRDEFRAHNEYLYLQVMNVTQPGTYLLDGTYKESYESSFLFIVDEPNEKSKLYVNDPGRSSFVVNITAIINWKKLLIPGLKGTFSGVLYNEAVPSDSLIIDKGEFNFHSMTANYDLHCDF